MSPPPKISRRGMTIGGAVAIGAAVVAGGIFEGPRLFKQRASGRYADLVNLVDNPEQAAVLGKTIHGSGDVGPSIEELAQADLKKRLAGKTLPALMAEDSVRFDRMVEVDGWVIPLVLAEICVLAAESV